MSCWARSAMNPIGCGNSFRRWNAEGVRKWNPLDAGIHFDSQNWSASMFPCLNELLVGLVEWTPLNAEIHLDTSSRLRSSAFTAENEPHWVREFISFHVARPLENLLESRFWSCFRILLHDADRLKGMNLFFISIAREWILRLTLVFISDSWLEYHTFCS